MLQIFVDDCVDLNEAPRIYGGLAAMRTGKLIEAYN